MSSQPMGSYDTAAIPSNFSAGSAVPAFPHDSTNVGSRAHQAYIAAGICLPLILIFVSLRIYAKLFILRTRTWDDYTFVLATLCTIVFISLNITVTIESNKSLRSWDPTLYTFTKERIIRLSVLYWTLYEPFVFIIKLSLFLLYLQIFDSLRWLRGLVWSGIVVTGMVYLSTMIWILIACTPRRGSNYLESFASPACRNMVSMSLVVGIFSVISDFYLLIIPIPAILPLQLPTRQKVGVITVFMAGFLACICSVISLVYRVRLNQNIKRSWDLIPLHMVTTIEMTTGIIVLCMPAFSAIVRNCHRPLSLFVTNHGRGFTALSSTTKRHSDAETADSLQHSGDRDSSRQAYALQDMSRDHRGLSFEEGRLRPDDERM